MTTGNDFLDSIRPEDFDALRPALRPLHVDVGAVLIHQASPVDVVHFPLDAQLANVVLLRSGRSVETSLVGREGLSGLAPVMARQPCPWQVQVRVAGEAFAAPAEAVTRLAASSPAFNRRLIVLAHLYQAQAAQTAACNAQHSVAPRVARWLLTARDLGEDDALQFTQSEMALLLGCPRTSVVEAFTRLKERGVIGHRRGRILIQDRAALQRESCECYGVLRDLADAARHAD